MKKTIVTVLAILWALPVSANQLPPITNSDDAVKSLLNNATQTTVTINNQSFAVSPPAPQARTLMRSPSAFAIAAPQVQVTPGMVVRQASTGQNATVSGRLSVLFQPGVDVMAFIQSYGLTVHRQLGVSRFYLLEAGAGVDLLALVSTLSAAEETEAVKLELVSQLMKPL